MTLQQLRYLVATVESGFNISRAAQSVHTSQPGISKQLRLLEQQLGTVLLARNSSRIVGLTDNGEKVYEAAQRILRETRGLAQMGEDFMGQQSGRLTIATLHTYAHALVPPAAARFRQQYPNVAIELLQASPGQIIELVRAGEADIGISMETPDERSGVCALPFLKAPRALLVPKDHPLLDCEKLTLEEMAKYPFVVQAGLTTGGWAVSQVLKARGFNIEAAVTAPDASLMKACIEQGLGIAIMSSLMYHPDRDPGLRALDVSHLFDPSDVTLLLDPYRYLRGYVHHFIQMIAPEWERARVAERVREFVIANEPTFRPVSERPSPARNAGKKA